MAEPGDEGFQLPVLTVSGWLVSADQRSVSVLNQMTCTSLTWKVQVFIAPPCLSTFSITDGERSIAEVSDKSDLENVTTSKMRELN